MKKYAKLTPQGSRDFLFEECDDRKKAESVLSALYKEKSYRKVITPTVEYMDVFDDGDSGMDSDIMYKLSDSAGRTTVLRPDNTMPIARLVATRLSADDFPVRLYYNQNVFVRNKALAGRTDEIPQSGIELIGDGSFDADIEVLTMAAEALKRSQLNSFSFEIGHAGFFKAVLSKAPDVITYVEHGVCDIGIVGKDTIVEHGSAFYEVLDLNIGKCKFALACPKGSDFFSGHKRKTVATKYPKVAGEYLRSMGMDVDIIKIEGSVELAPLLGLADGIVDIVETGSTLKENGLEVVREIFPISARVIVNMASMKLRKKEIEQFLSELEQASKA